MKKTTIGKEVVYKVKPNNPSEMTDYIILRLTPSGRIHRITVYSREMKSTQCEIAKSELRRNVEKKHPNLGYYAMDEAEMFYEDPRTYTIECSVSGTKTRLKREYSDEEPGKNKS